MDATNISSGTSSETTTTNNNNNTKALRTSDIAACARHLAEGGLVAFPTETVYGLGCSALNDTAIQAVFDAKERPLTDPLIVHVLTPADAFRLWRATSSSSSFKNQDDDNDNTDNNFEARLLQTLCAAFWPGPLTLVAAANLDIVPTKIMAGTGFCACRSPRGATARRLLELARLPLAAPSANKFGHVSPTTAQHVWDDLQGEEGVWILEVDDNDAASLGKTSSRCEVGVESTVAKVERRRRRRHQQQLDGDDDDDDNYYVVTVLRQGAISVADIAKCLEEAGMMQTDDKNDGAPPSVLVTSKQRATADHVANVAPGQCIRHYSPHVASYLVSEKCIQEQPAATAADEETTFQLLQQSVVLDYAGRLVAWKDAALAYRDLSEAGDSAEAAQTVFDTLRWAERVAGAERILFPELELSSSDDGATDADALTLALKDRLTRAASGVVVDRLRDAI